MPLIACTCSPNVINAGIEFSMISEVNSAMTDSFFRSFLFIFYFFESRHSQTKAKMMIKPRKQAESTALMSRATGARSRTGKQLWSDEMRQQTTVELGRKRSDLSSSRMRTFRPSNAANSAVTHDGTRPC